MPSPPHRTFTTLPIELLLEILSYFPAGQIKIEDPTPEQRERRFTLQSLSETCHRFRQLFRPSVWEHVEVYPSSLIGKRIGVESSLVQACRKEAKVFASALFRQLDLVTIDDPELAQYVQVVDIVISDAALQPVFEKLYQSFQRLPNLHTVKIRTIRSYHHSSSSIENEDVKSVSKRVFKPKIHFPQIRSAILSRHVYGLLRVCPNLESLATFDPLPRDSMYFKVWTGLRKLCLAFPRYDDGFVAKHFSSLREITVKMGFASAPVDEGNLKEIIRKLKNPTTLFIDLPARPPRNIDWTLFFRTLPPEYHQNLKEVILTHCPCSADPERRVLDRIPHPDSSLDFTTVVMVTNRITQRKDIPFPM